MKDKANQRPLRVLQLTDPHLMADPASKLLGVNTTESLDSVIAQVLRDQGQPDLILATGDIAQEATEEVYRLFSEKLEAFQCESAWIAGNHDESPLLAKVASERQSGQRHILKGGWQFVLLDTSVPGEVFGELADSELAFLQQTLIENPDIPALVTLHHHPIDIEAEWMTSIGLKNRDAFWQVIDRFPQVKIVLWGHIHQELDRVRNGIRMLASPSTCVQFKAGSVEFSVEDKSPGYRWLELWPSGEFATEVGRAKDFVFDLDSDSSGY